MNPRFEVAAESVLPKDEPEDPASSLIQSHANAELFIWSVSQSKSEVNVCVRGLRPLLR